MGRTKAKKEPGGATLASLPQEVVLRLFSVKKPGDADTFLSLKDRVRGRVISSGTRSAFQAWLLPQPARSLTVLCAAAGALPGGVPRCGAWAGSSV